MRESKIEAILSREVRAAGGRSYKFVSPGNAGVPDRIILLPGGKVIFIELKTEVGRLSPVQRQVIAGMKTLGADVRVLYGEAEVRDFIREEVSPYGI